MSSLSSCHVPATIPIAYCNTTRHEYRCQTLDEEHPDTLSALNNLAVTLKQQGNLAEAEQLERQVLEALLRTR